MVILAPQAHYPMKVVVQPIRSDSDYHRALDEFERCRHAPIDTPEGDKADVLIDLVQAYERRKVPQSHSNPAAAIDIPAPLPSPKGGKRGKPETTPLDPVSAIKEVMRERGMKPIDLGPILGSTPRAYEVLSGKRGLSIAMIRSVHKELGIPLEILVGE